MEQPAHLDSGDCDRCEREADRVGLRVWQSEHDVAHRLEADDAEDRATRSPSLGIR